MPQAVYHTAIWRIRDYYRIKKLADDIISENNAVMDGMPKTNSTSDTVAQKVIKRDRYLKEIENIDSALLEIPQEYRNYMCYNNIVENFLKIFFIYKIDFLIEVFFVIMVADEKYLIGGLIMILKKEGLTILFIGKDAKGLIPNLVIKTREFDGEPNDNPEQKSYQDVKFVASFRNIEDAEAFYNYCNENLFNKN